MRTFLRRNAAGLALGVMLSGPVALALAPVQSDATPGPTSSHAGNARRAGGDLLADAPVPARGLG